MILAHRTIIWYCDRRMWKTFSTSKIYKKYHSPRPHFNEPWQSTKCSRTAQCHSIWYQSSRFFLYFISSPLAFSCGLLLGWPAFVYIASTDDDACQTRQQFTEVSLVASYLVFEIGRAVKSLWNSSFCTGIQCGLSQHDNSIQQRS